MGIGNQRASGAIRRMINQKPEVRNDGKIVIGWLGWLGWLVGDVESRKWKE